MKKIFVLLVMMMTVAVMAQQKVAILETVDKAENVSYGVKLLLRSSLTSAISNTPGYEGYDRVDMASIAGEQEFQRTGNVSDDQIKQIGNAAGASYVLVAEAARYDAMSIIITAKLLDVVTFGVKSSAVMVTGISADEMQESCNTLAAKLLELPLSQTNIQPMDHQRVNEQQYQQQAESQIQENTESVGTIIRLPNGEKLNIYTSPTPMGLNPAIFGHTQVQANNVCSCIGEGWRLPTSQELLSLYYATMGNSDLYIKLSQNNVFLNVLGRWNWAQEEGVMLSGDKKRDGMKPQKKKGAFFCVKEIK